MINLEDIKEELGQAAGTFDADMAYQDTAAEWVQRLIVALHEAIRRPMGVVPDSASDFYDPAEAERAEARRPKIS